jgi:DNA-directed RNA polymerase specialized sigma24 family protein
MLISFTLTPSLSGDSTRQGECAGSPKVRVKAVGRQPSRGSGWVLQWRERAERRFGTLNSRSAAARLLVDMMGYPVLEAAEILGVPEGTLKSRAVRARAALAGRLEHAGDQA